MIAAILLSFSTSTALMIETTSANESGSASTAFNIDANLFEVASISVDNSPSILVTSELVAETSAANAPSILVTSELVAEISEAKANSKASTESNPIYQTHAPRIDFTFSSWK